MISLDKRVYECEWLPGEEAVLLRITNRDGLDVHTDGYSRRKNGGTVADNWNSQNLKKLTDFKDFFLFYSFS